MSVLRSECHVSRKPAIADETAYYLICESVARRQELIHGRLDGPDDSHCAMGAFWADNPRLIVRSALVDEVAAVNDSIPVDATPRVRQKKVLSWLRWRLRTLAVAPTRG